MRFKFGLSFILISLFSPVFGQEAVIVDHLNRLVGQWVGEGSGRPGEGKGSFTFQWDLDGKVLMRKNQTEFPAQGNAKAITHSDLMVIFQESPNSPWKADYFDNEGHVIHYLVSHSADTILFTSEPILNRPTFRLSYAPAENGAMMIKFEIAPDGTTFKTYLQGKSHRTDKG